MPVAPGVGDGHFLFHLFPPGKCSMLHTFVLLLQREVVSTHLDSGRSADEEGVEDAFELLYEINERVRTGIWVGDCFIYNNSSWRLNYCVGGEVSYYFSMLADFFVLVLSESQEVLILHFCSGNDNVSSGPANVPAWISC